MLLLENESKDHTEEGCTHQRGLLQINGHHQLATSGTSCLPSEVSAVPTLKQGFFPLLVFLLDRPTAWCDCVCGEGGGGDAKQLLKQTAMYDDECMYARLACLLPCLSMQIFAYLVCSRHKDLQAMAPCQVPLRWVGEA